MKLLLEKGANPLTLPLNFAILQEGFEDIAELLIQNDSNNVNESRYLHTAIEANKSKIVHLLLSKGADVLASDGFNVTALHVASRIGNCEFIQLLIDHNADINARTNYGVTPLAISVNKSDLEAVKILLLNGAEPNSTSNGQNHPLHLAASKGTAWKFQDFSITQILHEINFGDYRS